jgi:hypothetical protein
MVKGEYLRYQTFDYGEEFNILISRFMQGVGRGELGEVTASSIMLCKCLLWLSN